ncbi:MAG: hypothetical protein SGPRY_002408, partial [Prymnesium sp.]
MAEGFRSILHAVDCEDPSRAGLKATPKRAARAFAFLTSGYRSRLQDVVGDAIFPLESSVHMAGSTSMLVIRNIRVDSL